MSLHWQFLNLSAALRLWDRQPEFRRIEEDGAYEADDDDRGGLRAACRPCRTCRGHGNDRSDRQAGPDTETADRSPGAAADDPEPGAGRRLMAGLVRRR
jgi:hypothetical protein